jgi:hypothetical protein
MEILPYERGKLNLQNNNEGSSKDDNCAASVMENCSHESTFKVFGEISSRMLN